MRRAWELLEGPHQPTRGRHYAVGGLHATRPRKRQASGLSRNHAGGGLHATRPRKRQASGLSRHHAGGGLRAPRPRKDPPAPSTDQDGAVERLVSLFLAGAITPQTYVNGLRVLAETPLTPAPIPPPRRRRSIQAPRATAEEGEQPRRRRILPVPPNTGEQPCRRRIPPALPSTGEQPRRRRTLPNPQQLAFHRIRWTIGSYLRGWQMDVPQGHPNGADPRAFLVGVRQTRGRDKGSERG